MSGRTTPDDGFDAEADEIEIDDDALEMAAGGPFTKPVNTTVCVQTYT